jgi:hypothetical protein
MLSLIGIVVIRWLKVIDLRINIDDIDVNFGCLNFSLILFWGRGLRNLLLI